MEYSALRGSLEKKGNTLDNSSPMESQCGADGRNSPLRQPLSETLVLPEPVGNGGHFCHHLSSRIGCVLPAVESVTAVTVGSVMAAVPQGSSFI